ncbi:MAG: transcription-repair coupling factor [Oscillospiraceae bacterium]|nr:transcription-repair coupling factor [Oscillospiraceae bacterium]
MLLKEIAKTQEFIKLYNEICSYSSPIALFGLSQTARAAFISAVQQQTGRTVLVLAKDEKSANRLNEDLMFFGEKSQVFPARDLTLRPLEGYSREYEYRRIKTLGYLVSKRAQIVVATMDAALMYTMPKEKFLQNTLTIKDTTVINPKDLIQSLVNAGYIRRDMVEGPGQFAQRGDIVDLYTPDMPLPVRIEFWGDEIDRINTFELETQRRTQQIKKVHISPVKEVLFTTPQQALSAIGGHRKNLNGKNLAQFDTACEKDVITLKNDMMPQAMDKYISLCYDEKATLFDYLDNPIVFVDDYSAAKENYAQTMWHLGQDMETLLADGVISKDMTDYYAPFSWLLNVSKTVPTIVAEDFVRSVSDITLSNMVNFTCHNLPSWAGEYKVLAGDVEQLIKQGYKIVVLAGTKKSAQGLARDLESFGYSSFYMEKDAYLSEGTIGVAAGHTQQGFDLPQYKLCLITGRKLDVAKQNYKRQKAKDAISSIDEISKGDYVVHQNYGIGIYDGIHNVSMQGVTKDYLKINFQGKDSLFVPVTQLDLISRYTYAQSDEKVTLSKLGGESWKKTKAKAKKATQEMAAELIRLYAEREHSKGFAFDEDTEWQRDFEARFIYDETEDQLKSIAEIKKDMESQYPMERLLCGDVGVGKTEVALRAAFKAVMSNKQVAILVPTTVLAWQHYNTLIQRMESFPINIQLLSRFRTAKQREQTIKDINSGVANIVVGTHALIQKKVKFKDLGLVIIDEEQRFGVAHKEKLVEGFKGVDVLTLSATPIPRTLSMALNGIRDMSTIEKPPFDRIPIETYVSEYDEKMVAFALNRELNRGGQCYYLYNRVETIDNCALRVQRMCPNARVAVAHGQMDEATLSGVWQQLINGEIDILVCTTIIETGIDVPNCNTLIIEDSDRMGLSQLYQIRGRVGRSTRKAYAYFTFQRNKVLNEVAVKRLNAIREFTNFGSGFKIAMRDLQIRGAGSILGKTQSGFMSSIGYDLYVKLLNQAIAVEKGEEIKTEKSDCLIDITVDAFIPEKYIPYTQNRIESYKRIAALENEEDVSDLLDELIDRYGDVPQSVMGLIDISLLRVMASSVGINEVVQRKDQLVFYSADFAKVDMGYVLKNTKHRISVNSAAKPFVSAQIKPGESSLEVMKDMLNLFKNSAQQQNEQ